MVDMEISQDPRGISLCIIAQRKVPTKWMFHMMGIQKSLPSGMFWQHIYVLDKYYDVARQQVVEKALATNTEWIMFIDTDVFLPADGINRLMSHAEKVVSGVYWMKSTPPQPIVYKTLGGGPIWNIEPQDKLIPIDGAGLGCCLIHRSVFENMPKPWFKVNWSYKDQSGQEVKVSVGEDHYFFMKAKQHGFQPYCDSNVMCDHYDVVNDVFYPGKDIVKKISKKKLAKAGQLHLLDGEKKQLEKNLNPSIVFYNTSGVKFNGNSISEKSIAGSETAVIRTAKEFANRACSPEIYCNCDSEGIYDGVKYSNYDKLSMVKECDIFIASRNTDIFTMPQLPKAKKYVLWAHDMPDCPGWLNIANAIHKIDKIIFVSEYHKNIIRKEFPFIPAEKCIISKNGVHDFFFGESEEKVSNKLVYSTTPFRGLNTLLNVFPKIREAVPDATLEIFSGMDIYNLAAGSFQTLFDRAKSMEGVTYHGTVKQEKLAKELQKCYLFAYPNIFAETSCIAAMENIKAGNPVVTTKFGALPETVGKCGSLIELDPRTAEYEKAFTDEIISILKNKVKWETMHAQCLRRTEMDWSYRAQELYQKLEIDMFRETIQEKKVDKYLEKNWFPEDKKVTIKLGM